MTSTGSPDPSDPSCRPLRSREELRACVTIQEETWGEDAGDIVPASLLSVATKVGGVVAGAFAGGRLAGFVFGLAGWRQGRRCHWSHMLAVRREHRNRGIGRRLKWLQRELLLEDGVETAYWTYDPLVARNAHFNLNVLGARVDEFVVDMYGSGGSSPLHVGGSTDRFILRWELASPRVRRTLAGDGDGSAGREPDGPPGGEAASRLPTVDPREAATSDPAEALPEPPALRLALPGDAVALDREDPEAGRTWRLGLRAALRHYLSRGFRVDGFRPAPGEDREDRAHYLLRR